MSLADIAPLIAPAPIGPYGKWSIVAHRNLCLGPPGHKHISGGAAFASVIAALEVETGRPLIHAAAQFLSSAKVDQPFEIVTRKIKSGRSISQVMAAIDVEGEDVANVTAALGQREDQGHSTWEIAPDLPPPDASPPVPFVRMDDSDLHSLLDMRLALDPRANPAGRACFWVRTGMTMPVPSALLALVADYLPEAIHMNIGRRAGAVSLDNVIRLVRRAATEWLLCDIQLSAVSAGIFHGRIAIFDDGGSLLATGAQSGVVRIFAD